MCCRNTLFSPHPPSITPSLPLSHTITLLYFKPQSRKRYYNVCWGCKSAARDIKSNKTSSETETFVLKRNGLADFTPACSYITNTSEQFNTLLRIVKYIGTSIFFNNEQCRLYMLLAEFLVRLDYVE